MVPYKDNGHLTASQKTYNYKLSSTRQDIEQAFGLLKGRWRKLFYLDMLCQRKIVSVIVAACVLHNFCLMAELKLKQIRWIVLAMMILTMSQ